ncbi:ABC transporter permease [Aquimarina agarivorans]|uniref:ABC transporter permease n=1 Tax=Aquimarina agarivorans TaxID=980584 RepID=UPI000248ED16|nr:ABC transporter permease [Aquimarina agarivorans]
MNSNLFNKDLWKEIIESIRSNGFRTIITAFGVFWGIFILVLLLAASNGLKNGILRAFDGTATNTVFVWAQGISKSYKGLPKGRRYQFDVKDAEAIRRNIKGLETVSPRNRLGGYGAANSVQYKLNSGSYSVYGDYPEISTQQSLGIQAGRFMNYSDIESNRKVAIIGVGVKNELFTNGEDALSKYIKIQGVSFKVVGIYKKMGSGGGDAIEKQREIYIPFTTYDQAFNNGSKVGFFAITADDNHTITSLKEPILALLRERHNIHPEDKRAIGNFDLFEMFNNISGLFIALTGVAYFVGFLILISGIIGISNIMLIVIKERTKEIGVRRALGATPANIRSQVLIESLFLTIISGMAGVSFAAFLIAILNFILDKIDDPDMMFANPSVSLINIALALFILTICGLLAGLIPAQTAIKIKPIEALRNE